MNTSLRAACPAVQTTVGIQNTWFKQRVIGSEVRAPCGDESVLSSALLCYHLLCMFRAREDPPIINDLGIHVYAPACAGTTFTQYYQRAVYLGDWNVARDNKQARALLVPPGGSMNMIA